MPRATSRRTATPPATPVDAWHLDGNARLLGGKVTLQGRWLDQANNLRSQKLHTVDRRSLNLGLAVRPGSRVTSTFTGMLTTTRNDAAEPTRVLDNVASALTGNVAFRHQALGRPSTLTLGGGVQRAENRNPRAPVPLVTTASADVAYQHEIGAGVRLSPSVALVRTGGEGIEDKKNLRFGIRGDARFLEDDALRTTLGVDHATSEGREVFTARGRLTWEFAWGTPLTVQLRHVRHSALNFRPAFEETFLTLSLARTF